MADNSTVPAWPVVSIELSIDDTVHVDGVRVPVPPGAHPRAVALEVAAATARSLGRPVRAVAKEPDGTAFPLIVAQDGAVSASDNPVPPASKRRSPLGRRKRTTRPVFEPSRDVQESEEPPSPADGSTAGRTRLPTGASDPTTLATPGGPDREVPHEPSAESAPGPRTEPPARSTRAVGAEDTFVERPFQPDYDLGRTPSQPAPVPSEPAEPAPSWHPPRNSVIQVPAHEEPLAFPTPSTPAPPDPVPPAPASTPVSDPSETIAAPIPAPPAGAPTAAAAAAPETTAAPTPARPAAAPASAPAPTEPPVPVPLATPSEPTEAPESLPTPIQAQAAPADPAPAPIQARERLQAPADPDPQPAPMPTPVRAEPTEEQAQAILEIARSVRSGAGDRALALAASLDASVENGGDEHALPAAREVHAYVALLAGRPALAVRLYADAALARGTHPEDAARMTENAHHCWLRVDETEAAYDLGSLVLRAYSTIPADAGLDAARDRMRLLRTRLADS